MNRRRFLGQSGLVLAGLGLSPSQQLLAQSLLPAAGQFHLIRNHVGYYTERGGTIGWLLHPAATAVVDTQFMEQSANLLQGLQAKQGFESLDLLINTHHHGDHTSGNMVFKDMVSTHIAHTNAKANQARVAKERNQLETNLLPAQTYTDEWRTQLGEESVKLRYFGPGHTNGDSVIHFENANVAHLGDLVFNRRFPYIDPKSGGTFRNWAKVMKKITRTFDRDTIFIFGHAAASYRVTGTLTDVKAMENYIRRLLDYVKKEKKKGTSQEQLLAKTAVIPGAEEWRYGERLRAVNLKVAWEEV
ncbi:MAG: MBL fold metallo-hydrolase [Bacteroidota bacterium]